MQRSRSDASPHVQAPVPVIGAGGGAINNTSCVVDTEIPLLIIKSVQDSSSMYINSAAKWKSSFSMRTTNPEFSFCGFPKRTLLGGTPEDDT